MITMVCRLTSKDGEPRSSPARRGIIPRYLLMKSLLSLFITFLALAGQRAMPQQEVKAVAPPAATGVRVGVFPEEVSKTYTVNEGVPSNDIRSIAVTASGDVYAGTARGLARFSAGQWATLAAEGEAVEQVAARGDDVWFTSAGK